MARVASTRELNVQRILILVFVLCCAGVLLRLLEFRSRRDVDGLVVEKEWWQSLGLTISDRVSAGSKRSVRDEADERSREGVNASCVLGRG